MTDTPEKIWVQPDPKGYCITGVWPYQPSDQPNATAHIPFDQHLALVAAAYLDAANLHQSLWRETSAYKTDQIIKRTPADAQAALERVKRETRNEALREAADHVSAEFFSLPSGDASRSYNAGVRDAIEAILALMEDTDDE